MAFWPFFMGAAALLTIWGARHGAWVVPALALLGYVLMRVVVLLPPDGWREVATCTLWLCLAAVMMYHGGWVPGFFYGLSGLTYAALLPLGFRIEYLGLAPVIAEGFAIAALLSIGGGIYGLAHHPGGDSDRSVDRLASAAAGVAARQTHP